MKKHELIKFAYDNYPKGTVARFKSAPNVDHVSDGTFTIKKDEYNGIYVLAGDQNNCFFSEKINGEINPSWAEVIPEEILCCAESQFPISVSRDKAVIKCVSDSHKCNIIVLKSEFDEINKAFDKLNQ